MIVRTTIAPALAMRSDGLTSDHGGQQHGGVLECRVSRPKALRLVVLGAAMVAVSAYCASLPGILPRGLGGFGILFFGAALVAIAGTLFRREPQVVLGPDGIDDRRLGIGAIPWSDVRSLSVRSMRRSRFLCVDLHEPDRHLARLSRWKRGLARANRALGHGDLAIGFQTLTPGIAEVLAHLERTGIPAPGGSRQRR